MQQQYDPLIVIRAELCERLDGLRYRIARRDTRSLGRDVNTIRHIAAAYGLTAVVRVADALERSRRLSGIGSASLYLDGMQDAIGCGPSDDVASQTLLASISVRLHH